MVELTHTDHAAADCRYQAAIEQQELTLFSMLKPSLQRDGNQWCVLYGDDLQVGVAGFGASPHEAVMDFNSQWYKAVEAKA